MIYILTTVTYKKNSEYTIKTYTTLSKHECSPDIEKFEFHETCKLNIIIK